MAEVEDSAPHRQVRRGLSRATKPKRAADEAEADFEIRLAEWRDGDRAYMRAYSKARRVTDEAYADDIRARSRAWKKRNREHIQAYRAEYFRRNKDRERLTNKLWLARNPHAKAGYDLRYRAKHKAKLRTYFRSANYLARRRQREKVRYDTDPRYRAGMVLRASLAQALRLYGDGKKTQSARRLLGCSVADLVKHLERQFKRGMSWENHGLHGWHIDHIRPCALFDLTDPEQQRECFHFTNLRPLWAVDNHKKNKRRTVLL